MPEPSWKLFHVNLTLRCFSTSSFSCAAILFSSLAHETLSVLIFPSRHPTGQTLSHLPQRNTASHRMYQSDLCSLWMDAWNGVKCTDWIIFQHLQSWLLEKVAVFRFLLETSISKNEDIFWYKLNKSLGWNHVQVSLTQHGQRCQRGAVTRLWQRDLWETETKGPEACCSMC